MEVTKLDLDNLKTLEQYVSLLLVHQIELKTLLLLHAKAIDEGILDEELMSRGGKMMADLKQLSNIYAVQITEVLERLPENFDKEDVNFYLRKLLKVPKKKAERKK